MDFVISFDTNQMFGDGLYKEAERVRQAMGEAARQSLSPDSAALYMAGLMPVVPISECEVYFSLKGWLPMAIEAGIDPFDMKPGLLRSNKARTSKDGSRYLVVPLSGKGFAVVSTKSKPGSWIHPGITARRFWSVALKNTGYGD